MPTFKIGSGVGDNYATFLLPLPDVDWFKSALLGALFLMTNPNNWYEAGDVGVSFAIEEAAKMINNFTFMKFNPIPVGMIFPFGGAAAPDGYAICDGSTLSATDYPELFAVVGYTYGGSGDSFQVPNVVNRFVVGSGDVYANNDTGGESTHTLTTTEMPSHSHTIPRTITTLVVEPGEVTALTPIPFFDDVTGETGGDGAHNNLPPYIALTAIIYKGRL